MVEKILEVSKRYLPLDGREFSIRNNNAENDIIGTGDHPMLKLFAVFALLASATPLLAADLSRSPTLATSPLIAPENIPGEPGRAVQSDAKTFETGPATGIAPGSEKGAPLYVETHCENGCGHDDSEKTWRQKLGTDPNASFTGAVAILTLFLVIVGAAQGTFIYRQVRLARDEFNAGHPPVLEIRFVKRIHGVTEAKGWEISVINTGGSDATFIGARAVRWPETEPLPSPDCIGGEDFNLRKTFAPSERDRYTVTTWKSDLGAGSGGSERLIGWVVYETTTGIRRTTYFGFETVKGQEAVRQIPGTDWNFIQ